LSVCGFTRTATTVQTFSQFLGELLVRRVSCRVVGASNSSVSNPPSLVIFSNSPRRNHGRPDEHPSPFIIKVASEVPEQCKRKQARRTPGRGGGKGVGVGVRCRRCVPSAPIHTHHTHRRATAGGACRVAAIRLAIALCLASSAAAASLSRSFDSARHAGVTWHGTREGRGVLRLADRFVFFMCYYVCKMTFAVGVDSCPARRPTPPKCLFAIRLRGGRHRPAQGLLHKTARP